MNLLGRIEERILWQDVTLDLQAGECLALSGPSGVGKTLLLRRLALLDPLQGGELRLRGLPPSTWGVPAWRSRVLYLAQRPVSFPGTVAQNLREVFAYAAHRERRWQRERVVNWLDRLDRPPSFLERDAGHLSGGEAQLMALLRALQLDPDVLLLDEPTASLDSAATDRVEDLLRRWMEEAPRACLLVSHDEEQRLRLARRQLPLVP